VNVNRRIIQSLIVLVLGLQVVYSQSLSLRAPATKARDPLLHVGEELEYSVSYSIFTLGSIRLRVIGVEERNGQPVYKAQALINSAPGLPFVNLHVVFESAFDPEVFSYAWISRDSSKNEEMYLTYAFDYPNSRVVVEKSVRKKGTSRVVEKIDTVQLREKAQDGLSLFYFARKYLHQRAQVNVPTVIGTAVVNTFINYLNERTSVEIDAVDYPVDVIAFDGRADYTGIFGLTGGFQGWFSNDEARVPIVARMKVILGSIYIELVKWNRAGWQPPRYVKGR
jgi:hypothetical protein